MLDEYHKVLDIAHKIMTDAREDGEKLSAAGGPSGLIALRYQPIEEYLNRELTENELHGIIAGISQTTRPSSQVFGLAAIISYFMEYDAAQSSHQ